MQRRQLTLALTTVEFHGVNYVAEIEALLLISLSYYIISLSYIISVRIIGAEIEKLLPASQIISSDCVYNYLTYRVRSTQ